MLGDDPPLDAGQQVVLVPSRRVTNFWSVAPDAPPPAPSAEEVCRGPQSILLINDGVLMLHPMVGRPWSSGGKIWSAKVGTGVATRTIAFAIASCYPLRRSLREWSSVVRGSFGSSLDFRGLPGRRCAASSRTCFTLTAVALRCPTLIARPIRSPAFTHRETALRSTPTMAAAFRMVCQSSMYPIIACHKNVARTR